MSLIKVGAVKTTYDTTKQLTHILEPAFSSLKNSRLCGRRSLLFF